jgi:hypothetical protein
MDSTLTPAPRRSASLVVAYLLLALAWWGVAWRVAPGVIVEAYHGRSYAALNRVLQGRTHHSPEHYVALWESFAGAILLGMAAHLLLVLRVRARRPTGGVGLLAFVTAFLLVTILSGPRHDYVAFLEVWDNVRSGGDPWAVAPRFGYSLNAYGPLFNVLAPVSWVNPLAPKLLFAGVYLAHVIETVTESPSRSGRASFWVASPFFGVEIAWFGHFDILVGLCCVAAMRSVLLQRERRAGGALAVGILLKYLPVTLLPFLAASGRPRWRLVATSALGVALGIAFALAVWGPAVLSPLRFAATRGSSLASIFRFLRGSYSPLRLFVDEPNLDRFNAPVLAAGLLAAFLACRRLRATPDTAAVIGALTTVLLYQVGFPQYQVVVFLLLIDWCGRHDETLRARPLTRVAIDVYLGGFTLFNLVYAYAGGVLHPGDPLAWLDEVSGLVAFLAGVAVLAALLGSAAATGNGTLPRAGPIPD